MLDRFAVPPGLERSLRTAPGGMAWLRRLPAQYERYLRRWRLSTDLPPGRGAWSGRGAVVVPVRRHDGTAAALKLGFPHDEARAEADALEQWNGRGAVRLLQADKDEFTLLLDRLDGDRSLLQLPIQEAAGIWGPLVHRLSLPVPAEPGWNVFPRLAETAEQWTDELPAEWERLGRPFERWLLEAALEVCQLHGAVGRRSSNDVLVHSDLHYLNILPGIVDAQNYAAIDPKPVIGDAEFALAPMLWNRLRDLSVTEPARDLLSRLQLLAAAAGMDAELARQWSLVREVQNALGSYDDGRRAEAARSLWVAGTLAGRAYPGVPAVHELPEP